MGRPHLALLLPLAATAAGLAYVVARETESEPAPAPTNEPIPGRIVRLARRLSTSDPAHHTTDATDAAPLTDPHPEWDWVLGGATGTKDRWGLYSWAPGNPWGTTCGIWCSAVAAKLADELEPIDPERARKVRALANRRPPEGLRYAIGESIARLYQGGRDAGWLTTFPAASAAAGVDVGAAPEAEINPLRPGDVYCVHRHGATLNGRPVSGEHVGIVLRVDGATVITADGGQTDRRGRQCALRRERTVRRAGAGWEVATVSGPARLAWIVRVEGSTR